MRLEHLSPAELRPNSWNSNHVDFDNMDRLRASLLEQGWVKPVLARKTAEGYEIIGGQHRVEIARTEPSLCPVPTVVFDDMSDDDAKRIGLTDNIRYGEDDTDELGKILDDIGIDFAEMYLPVDLSELALLSTQVSDSDIESMLSEEPEVETTKAEKKAVKDVRVIRFKVSNEDAARIEAMIKRTQDDLGFKDADKLTNAGDALAHILLSSGDEE